VPTLAALSGDAVGAGLELALACHLRSAARHVSVSLPEVRLGLVPGHGGTQRLPRLVGRSRALALMLTGRAVGAEEALQSGLVDAVFDDEELIPGSRRLLEGAVRGAPSAVRLLLEAVREGEELPLADGLRLEASLFGLAFAEPSAREGMQAFLEKREPRFGDA